MIRGRAALIMQSIDELVGNVDEKGVDAGSSSQATQFHQVQSSSNLSSSQQTDFFLNILPCIIANDKIVQTGPMMCLVYQGAGKDNFSNITQMLKKSNKQTKYKYLIKIKKNSELNSIIDHHMFIDEPTLQATIKLYLANNKNECCVDIKAIEDDHEEAQPTQQHNQPELTLIEKVKLRINTAIEIANEEEKKWLQEIQVFENEGQIFMQFMDESKVVKFQKQSNVMVCKILTSDIIDFVRSKKGIVTTNRKKRKRKITSPGSSSITENST